MLEFALTLLLTAGPADHAPPTVATPTNPTLTVISTTGSPIPGLHGKKKRGWTWHKKKKRRTWRKFRKSKSKSKRRRGNRPVPGPVPLALLGLGICGVAGARYASKRRRK